MRRNSLASNDVSNYLADPMSNGARKTDLLECFTGFRNRFGILMKRLIQDAGCAAVVTLREETCCLLSVDGLIEHHSSSPQHPAGILGEWKHAVHGPGILPNY